MKAPSLLLSILLLASCQVQSALAPNPTAPATSNQVLTLAPTVFAAELAGTGESPAVSSEAHGYGVFLLNPARDTLTVKLYVAGLSGPAKDAHLHVGATGKSGDVVKTLTVAGNVITGSWKKSDAQEAFGDDKLASLLKGEIYVNVHTEKKPDGEIRGQLGISDDTIYPIYLSGAEEVPPVSGNGTGVAWLRVSRDQSQMLVHGYVYGLSGAATAAHLHKGAKGSSGEVLKDVTVSGNSLNLLWKKTDASGPLTPGVIDLLQQGQVYLNAHTVANPNGEVRGQAQ